MSDELALLTAIIANPDEDTPRLMFADWLQENGQPERAEFIRVQIEVNRLPDRHLKPLSERAPDNVPLTRFRELFAAHHEAWLRPLGVNLTRATFRRGFIEELRVTPDELLSIDDETLHREMLSTIDVNPPRVEEAEEPPDDSLGDAVLRRLAAWPGRARLRRLHVGGLPLTAPAVEAFLTSPPACGLQSLSFGGCHFDASVIRVVSACDLPELTVLGLSSCALSADDVLGLARAPHLKKLQRVWLHVPAENDPDAPEALRDACRELRTRYPNRW